MYTAKIIFGAIHASASIAGYMGLIETVRGNVQKLLHQSFKSAIQNLEYAKTASDDNRLNYIRIAQEKFIDAITVEEDENLISALVGLAMCQHLLGDEINMTRTLSRIDGVKLSTTEKTKQIGKTCLKILGFRHLYYAHSFAKGRNPFTGDYYERLSQFEEYKRLALAAKDEGNEIKNN